MQYQMQHKHDMTEATIDVEAKEQKQQIAVREQYRMTLTSWERTDSNYTLAARIYRRKG